MARPTVLRPTKRKTNAPAWRSLFCSDYVDSARIADDKPLITGPDATGGQREYGARVEDTWTDEVEKTLND